MALLAETGQNDSNTTASKKKHNKALADSMLAELENLTFEPSKHATKFRLIPQVVTRILDVLHPIDQITCIPVNELFNEAADDRMYYMLTMPKYAGTESECFLLEWSDAYTNGFITNVWRQLKDSYDAEANGATVGDPNDREFRFQLDKASRAFADNSTRQLFERYETFLLDLIYDNLPQYTQLRTLLVDLNASFYNRSGRFFYQLTGYKWAHLIRTIALQCSNVLEKFLYVDADMPQYEALVLYKNVNFPQIFANLSNLRVLYMPQIDLMCGGVKQLEYGQSGTDADPWRALNELKPADRLPKLERLVMWRGDLVDIMNYMRPVLLQLPSVKRVEIGRGGFPKTTNDPLLAGKYVFPKADIVLAYNERETEVDFKTMHMYFGIHRRPEPDEYYQHVATRIAPLAEAVDDAATHSLNSLISAHDNAAVHNYQRTRHTLQLEPVHKPGHVSNSSNFDAVMVTLLHNPHVSSTPMHSRRWICTVTLEGTQEWSTVEQILRYWRCTLPPQTAVSTTTRCACGRDSTNQMRLRLLIRSRHSLDQVLAKWAAECNDLAELQQQMTSENDEKSTKKPDPLALFNSHYHIDRVTFQHWLKEASSGNAQLVEGRMYDALYAVLRDARIEMTQRPSSFRSAVYERLRKIQFDLYNYVGPTVKFKANMMLYQQQLLSLVLAGALGDKLAFVGSSGKHDDSMYEQYFRLVLRNVVDQEEDGQPEHLQELLLPGLRKIIVNVQE